MKKSNIDLQFDGSSSSSNLYLPEEIVLKIITRLPVKSVGRFRCVSKHWRDLLSQPCFIKTHLNLSLNNPPYKALFFSRTRSSYFVVDFHGTTDHHGDDPVVFATELIKFDVPIYSWDLVFRCSHNGLILVQDGICDRLFLLNPTTLECKEFPKPSVHCEDLVFGMGNDKAVAVKRTDCNTVYVYAFKRNSNSTGTSTWKRLQIQKSALDEHGNVYFPYNANGVLFNGSIYWLRYTSSVLRFVPHSPVVIAFDLTEETIRAIPLPSIMYGWITLGVVGGSLCIVSQEIRGSSRKLDVWVMNEHDMEEPWTKISFYKNIKEVLRVIFLGNEEFVLIADDRSKAVIYNIKEKSSRDIVVSGLPKQVDYCCTFVDSLVSP